VLYKVRLVRVQRQAPAAAGTVKAVSVTTGPV